MRSDGNFRKFVGISFFFNFLRNLSCQGQRSFISPLKPKSLLRRRSLSVSSFSEISVHSSAIMSCTNRPYGLPLKVCSPLSVLFCRLIPFRKDQRSFLMSVGSRWRPLFSQTSGSWTNCLLKKILKIRSSHVIPLMVCESNSFIPFWRKNRCVYDGVWFPSIAWWAATHRGNFVLSLSRWFISSRSTQMLEA